MSDNPFASPEEGIPSPMGESYTGPKLKPGGIMPIAIICLILSVLGLLGSCMGLVSIGASSFLMDFVEQASQNAPADDPGIAFQKINMEAALSNQLINIITTVVGLIVAIPMLIGSIGCLRNKESGRTMLRTGLLLGIFNCLISLVLGGYAQYAIMGKTQSLIENYDGPADRELIQNMATAGTAIAIGTAVVMAIVSIAFAIFYFWSRGYLNKEEVVSYFRNSSQ